MILNGIKDLAISILEENPEILKRNDAPQVLKKRCEELSPEFLQDRLFQDVSPAIMGLVVAERMMAKQTL
ncbi:MAG: hypothetical protein CMP20_09210 [Rickettsiales bacterium]|nr:hypothetical protein [Rickettsiales bacterium]